MTTSVKYLKFGEHTIREVHITGQEPYFVLADVAKALGLTEKEALEICKAPVELQEVDEGKIDFNDLKENANV